MGSAFFAPFDHSMLIENSIAIALLRIEHEGQDVDQATA
jgi:hypothetical protein